MWKTPAGCSLSDNSTSGSDSDWGGILKQHELRKWSCISLLLPVALGGEVEAGDGMGRGMGQDLIITGLSTCVFAIGTLTLPFEPDCQTYGVPATSYAHVVTPPRPCLSV